MNPNFVQVRSTYSQFFGRYLTLKKISTEYHLKPIILRFCIPGWVGLITHEVGVWGGVETSLLPPHRNWWNIKWSHRLKDMHKRCQLQISQYTNPHCCIFRPAFGCCTLQKLVKIHTPQFFLFVLKQSRLNEPFKSGPFENRTGSDPHCNLFDSFSDSFLRGLDLLWAPGRSFSAMPSMSEFRMSWQLISKKSAKKKNEDLTARLNQLILAKWHGVLPVNLCPKLSKEMWTVKVN